MGSTALEAQQHSGPRGLALEGLAIEGLALDSAVGPGVGLDLGEQQLRAFSLHRSLNVTNIVQAVKTEEEEDIEILDVDEEEEASVKKAMGVGEAVGLPPVPASAMPLDALHAASLDFAHPFAAHAGSIGPSGQSLRGGLSGSLSDLQGAGAGFDPGSGSMFSPGGSIFTSSARFSADEAAAEGLASAAASGVGAGMEGHPAFARANGAAASTSSPFLGGPGRGALGMPYTDSAGGAGGHAFGIPNGHHLGGHGEEGEDGEEESPDIGGVQGEEGLGAQGEAFDLALQSAALNSSSLEEELRGLPLPCQDGGHETVYPDESLSARKRRRKSAGGSSTAAEGGFEWQLPTLQGVVKKTRQRSTRPANVESFMPFVHQQQQQHPHPQPQGEQRQEDPTPFGATDGPKRSTRIRRPPKHSDWLNEDDDREDTKPTIPLAGHSGRATKASARAPRSTAPIIQFSIRSFVVPELTVHLPEDATVGTLKQAVADATLAALSRGARLRVLVQGARVTNDSATLAQIGLSQSGLSEGGGGLMSDPDYLSFMMEPSGGDTPGSTPGASPFHDPLDTDPAFLLSPGPVPRRASGGSTKRSRSRLREPGTPSATPRSAGVKKQAAPFVGEAAGEGSTPAVPNPAFVPTRQAAAHAMAAIRAQSQAQAATHGMGVPLDDPEGLRGAFPEGEADAFHGGEGVGAGVGGSAAETAIILHPTAVQNVLSLPSAHQRSARGRYSRALVASSRGRSGSGSLQLVDHRRRIRRPFTVQEVAILVDAVETLGSKELEVAPLTSAWWREVKDFAFTDSRHRTSTDLKDKWKTLVHTAQIAPQQRRGEPVPQELLDRVMQAHSLWTEQLRTERDER